ncbi:MAG TPA: O-antigen ligase family protein [Bryobacteraceae bacterium]|nr:O-antigen ligase family protein [Bryobacteraceae bacterium]
MALLQAVVIALIALIITPGYLFYFDITPKIVVLLGGAAIALLSCGAAGIAGRGRVYRLFSLLLVLDSLSLSISTALSAKPALSAFGTNWRRFGSVIQAAVLLFAWLIASHAAGRPERVRAILRAIALAGGLSALYGIAQYFGWDPILPAAAYHIGEGIWAIVRPPGTLGYVSYFATWLLFVTFLGVALAAMESSDVWRRFAFGAAALSTVAMVLTGTRAAILGLLAGIAVGLYFRRRVTTDSRPETIPVGRAPWSAADPPVGHRPKAEKGRLKPAFGVDRAALTHEERSQGVARGPGGPPHLFRPILAVAAVLLAACVVFYSSPPGQRLRSRARWFAEDPWGGNRLALWRDSLRMAMPRLTQGYGPEVFTAAFPRFESKGLAEAYPDFLHESPHNIFLDALISQGLPGLLILCGLCYVGLQTPGRDGSAGGATTASVWIRAALAAGIVSQQFTVFTVPTALIFYVTIALSVALASDAAEPRRDWRFTFAAAPVALALLYLAARFTISDHALALARRSVETGNLPAAVAHFEQYQRWNLPGTSSDLWYSRALIGLAQRTPDFRLRYQAIAQSGAAAVRATEAAEDPFNAWYSLAALYAGQNDSARTEQSLRAAVAARPNWFKPHWTLAKLLLLENRMDEAEREAAVAAELDAGKNTEVTQTLWEIRAQRALRAPSEHK